MNLNGNVEMKGKLSIIVTGQDGLIKQEMVIPNLVVTAGKVYIASRMVGTASTVMSHMAIGLGTTSPAVTDTAMGSSLYRAAVTSFTATANVVTAVATFAGGLGTGAITEAGIFNAATNGTMLCRTTFPVVNKGVSDSIAITWAITVS